MTLNYRSSRETINNKIRRKLWYFIDIWLPNKSSLPRFRMPTSVVFNFDCKYFHGYTVHRSHKYFYYPTNALNIQIICLLKTH